jgi:hypothetical protein
LEASDATEKARILQTYYHGMMTQARILNNAEILRHLWKEVFQLLGIKAASAIDS